MIRTTITMPVEIHQDLRHQAVSQGVSFNDVVMQKILKDEKKDTRKKEQSIAEHIREDMAFFDSLAKEDKTGKTAAQLVREDRDERDLGYAI